MRIRFEEVGRDRMTWEAECPGADTLAQAAPNLDWWPRELRRALRSDPELSFDPVAGCVWIYAGWHRVGRAVAVEESMT